MSGRVGRHTRILAFDPGATTGWCFYIISVDYKLWYMDCGQIDIRPDCRADREQLNWVFMHEANVVLMEDAVPKGAINAAKIRQIQSMAIIEYEVSSPSRWLYVARIQPEERKLHGHIPKEEMKHFKNMPHARDAARLVYAWAVKNGVNIT